MQIANWQFNPGLWPSVAVLLLLPLLVRLGFWQLERAEQKQIMQEQYQRRSTGAAVNLNAARGALGEDPAKMQWQQAIVRGRFDAEPIFLLDNQVMGRRVGYFVYGVFSLVDEGRKILVNYGWVPVGRDRSRPPLIALPDGEQTLSGLIKKAPATGIKLAATEEENLGEGLYLVQEIDLEALAAETGWALFPYVLRLPGAEQESASSAFLRTWPAPGFGKERHLGYAFQWFALATALAIIYLVVNLKRAKRPDEEQR